MTTEVENAKQFWAEFNLKLVAIQDELGDIEANSDPTANVAKFFAKVKATLVGLQAFATDSTDILPAYDIRRTQEEIDSMGKKIRQKEELLMPRKKFRFSRGKLSAKNIPSAHARRSDNSKIDESTATVAQEAANKKGLEGSVLVVDKENETIILSDKDFARDDCNGQLLVQRCKGCSVHVTGVAGSIRLERLSDCTVLLGPSRTSVYIEDCTTSIFYVACHQLRIHKTTESKIYTRCRTHPIIEDCSTLGFAPYSLSYPGCEAHVSQANLADAVSWDNVVDFRWHRTTHSPNWFMIPQGSREDIVLTKSGVRVNADVFRSPDIDSSNNTIVVAVPQQHHHQVLANADDEDEL